MMTLTLLATRDISRMCEIIAVMAEYGLDGFLQRTKLSYGSADESASGSRYMSVPRRFRMVFEELGPTFIKLGQILSTRVDTSDAERIEEFEKLQSNVAPIPVASIDELIESYLGRPMGEMFCSFDSVPVGNASTTQVHKAVPSDGETVAMKIKRPDIEPVVQADSRILTHLAGFIESEIPEVYRYQPVQMVQYFVRSLAKGTDLSVELCYMQCFGQTFDSDPLVRIPRVYPDISNRQILVQKYIGDTLLKDTRIETLDAPMRTQLVVRITDTLFTMILQQGSFHADPHPGNIFIGSNGRITLIDFGLVGHLSSTRHREIVDLISALTRKDQFTMQYVLSNWAQDDLPDENLLGADVLEMLLDYEHTPVRDLRISQVINDITQIMRNHDLTLPGDLVMLFKTLITLEGVAKRLDDQTELLEHAKPIVVDAFKERSSPEHILRKGRMYLQMLLQAADELPQNLFRLSCRLQKDQMGIMLDFKRFDQVSHQIDRTANRSTMGIVTAALIISSSIVMSIETGPKFIGFIGYLLAFTNDLWIIWSVWRLGKH